jgi:hypothetical protein
MRMLIVRLPLQEEVCNECLMGWWRGRIVPLIEAPPTKPTRH